jgi:hypothetical protein
VDTGDYICLTCGADWDRNGAKAGPQDAEVFLTSALPRPVDQTQREGDIGMDGEPAA